MNALQIKILTSSVLYIYLATTFVQKRVVDIVRRYEK